MRVDLTQNGLIDWNNPADITRFDAIVYEIRRSGNDRLIELTVDLLGALGPHVPDDRRSDVALAALHLRTAWLDIETRWTDGTLRDFGEALDRRRPPNWRQRAHVKHRANGPRVFAEMSFDMSAKKTRDVAAGLASKKYDVSKRQAEAWYDSYRKELRKLVDAPAETLVDHPLILAFSAVARERDIDERAMFEEIRRAADR